MIHTVKTVRTLETIAVTIGFALFLWSTGLPTVFHFAKATAITDASDTVSDATPTQGSDHTIVFEIPRGLGVGETIELTFPTDADEFIFGSLDEDDVDILIDGKSLPTDHESGTGTWGIAIGSNTLTFTAPTDIGVASATPIQIRIGLNAVDFGTGSHQIINPSKTASYVIDIGGTMQDTGEIVVAIVSEGTATHAETSHTVVVSDDSMSSATSDKKMTNIPHQTVTPTF